MDSRFLKQIAGNQSQKEPHQKALNDVDALEAYLRGDEQQVRFEKLMELRKFQKLERALMNDREKEMQRTLLDIKERKLDMLLNKEKSLKKELKEISPSDKAYRPIEANLHTVQQTVQSLVKEVDSARTLLEGS